MIPIFSSITPKTVETLNKIINQETLSVSVGYKLFKIVQQINKAQNEVEKYRINLIHIYGLKDEEGNLVTEDGRVKLVNEEAFKSDYIKHINEKEIQIDQISIADLQDVKLRPADLFPLIGFVIKDDSDANRADSSTESVVSSGQIVS